MIRLRDLQLRPDEGVEELYTLAAKKLGIAKSDILGLKIRKKSIDARKKSDIRVIYSVDISARGSEARILKRTGKNAGIAKENEYTVPVCHKKPEKRPVIVGFGPAGMFAALTLAMAGLSPIVLERGQDVDTRTEKVQAFWNTGKLDTESNVQFGEGGAGTFSDGKLNTGISDSRIGFVLKNFYEFGANENILYDAKPHIGTDVLKIVVKNLREKVISLGGEVRFGAKMTKVVFNGGKISGVEINGSEMLDCSDAILAIGHSARDTFEMLHSIGVPMEPKAFSMGVRIEHLQSDIDRAQYGEYAERNLLPPADYKLNARFSEGDSAYTFCMCPGGYVVAAASEEGRLCTNGMSKSKRDGENANSALLVTLTPDMFPDKSTLGGMYWQRQVEESAFKAGGSDYRAPAQLAGDFLAGRKSAGAGKVKPTYRPGVNWCDLSEVLPKELTDTLKKAIVELGKKLKGFDDPEAVLTGAETRSSSPVRIKRGENLSSEISGLYPCGEGAGYAGGIVSAAVDGIKCAEAVINASF